jgi:uncharacterized protein YjbI with pentapeptide repeats
MSKPATKRTESRGIKVRKPKSVWQRDLTCDFKQLFRALGSGLKNGAKQDWAALAGDVLAGLTTIGFEKDLPGLAWVLMQRSMSAAVCTLIDDAKDLLPDKPPATSDSASKQIADALAEFTFTITPTFFATPGTHPVVQRVQASLCAWFEYLGLSSGHAQVLTGRLASYFTFALHDEWRQHPNDYLLLRQDLDTPFATASDRELLWLTYTSFLVRQADQRVFSEPFGLRHIYIPLRASFDIQQEKAATSRMEAALQPTRRHTSQVVMLDEALGEWIASWNSRDAIRVLSGGPGSGKSTAVRILASDWLSTGRVRTIYIPLHLFDWTADLIDAVHDYCGKSDYIPNDILDTEKGESRLLLIFDGLDELAKQGKLAAETALAFVREVQRTADRLNANSCRLLVLICGRPVAVQGAEADIRNPKQILHLLGYHVTSDERNAYKDPLGLLQTDHRNTWWETFGRLRGLPYAGLPQELRTKALVDITAQPLLNYLVALTYERKQIDFGQRVSLNSIYADLLSAVYDRAYEHRKSRSLEGLTQDQFTRILEEIAIATWHGNSRTTTVSAIRQYCENASLSQTLDAFADSAEAGITRLLTAFYFRQAGNDNGDKTFEFTHKTFGEYLTSKRILGAFRQIVAQIERRERSADDGLNPREALRRWVDVTGHSALDGDLFGFLEAECKLLVRDEAKLFHRIGSILLNEVVRNRMPVSHIQSKTFSELDRFVRNSESCLLAIVASIASAINTLTEVKWPDPTSAGSWIRRLAPQRNGPQPPLPLRLLSNMNLSEQSLDLFDFYGANLKNSVLKSAALNLAQFGRARLTDTDASRCQLYRATFLGNIILRGQFIRASLRETDFEHVEFMDCNFASALMAKTFFSKCRFKNCSFTSVKLRDAVFQGCTLDSASESALKAALEVKGNTATFEAAKPDTELDDAGIEADAAHEE